MTRKRDKIDILAQQSRDQLAAHVRDVLMEMGESICGQFWGGIESFEFGPGYCEHCAAEVESDCYDPDDDDGYDDEFFFQFYDDG